jgi:hypothetical protein
MSMWRYWMTSTGLFALPRQDILAIVSSITLASAGIEAGGS